MKILININHPAHVHYFRNFIKLMEAKGHRFCVINRDSNIINQLLDYYGIEHTIRNKRPAKKGTIASLMNLAKMVLWCIRKSLSFHPDLYMGFASSACAITSWLFRKPSIILDDTEFNHMNHKLYMPFCSTVLTPFYFQKQLDNGNKQIYFHAFIEQLFLHSKYYETSLKTIEELELNRGEYVVVRYSAFDAHHDMMAHPLSEEFKKKILLKIAQKYRVILSLEKKLDDPFYKPFLVNFSPEKMHDIESNAKFLVTEGITMASEAFIMGVPYLLINPLKCGYIDYQTSTYPELFYYSTHEDTIMSVIDKLMTMPINTQEIRKGTELSTINPTDFLIWFVENYPKSKNEIKNNPDLQFQFK